QLLGVEVLGQRRRAHQVTKHHRQLTPFRFRCNMWPCRCGRCHRTRSPPWSLCAFRFAALGWGRLPFCSQSCATLATELHAGGILKPAARTALLEPRATLGAESQPCGILKSTARTTHTTSLLFQAL